MVNYLSVVNTLHYMLGLSVQKLHSYQTKLILRKMGIKNLPEYTVCGEDFDCNVQMRLEYKFKIFG